MPVYATFPEGSSLPAQPITALSITDGRNAEHVDELREFFSEFALIRYRIHVEVEWLIALANSPEIPELNRFTKEQVNKLRDIGAKFRLKDARQVKNIEATTNHDVKAVEYYLKNRVKKILNSDAAIEFIHFGCTSEDINSVSYALILDDARNLILTPTLRYLGGVLADLSEKYADTALLSRTHGQPASPTTIGKEFRIFELRFLYAVGLFNEVLIRAKFSGAVGNYNAHLIAYPDIDWHEFTCIFADSIGVHFNAVTAQSDPHDDIAELCHALQRINTILIDLCRDMWAYISLGYFRQSVVEGEVGSSTMPHKVNPIDFENAEGNLGVANALLGHFAEKLPISRWQRDLSDSTVRRSLGTAIGHSLIAYKSALKGLHRLEPDDEKISTDLNSSWEVIGEAIQTLMRKHGLEVPYERLKKLTRGKKVTKEDMAEFINSLDLPDDSKQQLLKLEPKTYVGNAGQIASDEEYPLRFLPSIPGETDSDEQD